MQHEGAVDVVLARFADPVVPVPAGWLHVERFAPTPGEILQPRSQRPTRPGPVIRLSSSGRRNSVAPPVAGLGDRIGPITLYDVGGSGRCLGAPVSTEAAFRIWFASRNSRTSRARSAIGANLRCGSGSRLRVVATGTPRRVLELSGLADTLPVFHDLRHALPPGT
ncbi:hypothetical protein GCM10017786_00810 [Amycolatopsis deserti]|uniref:Anti-sigma factor antagonist n=1 Tax=Amycolatopsis deserti TaxID=185696 RepID=A0ABQ3IDJ0_9PSEU|nr:hypothetical protein GCM10017786_00810 [Amycolatopsis deserti]